MKVLLVAILLALSSVAYWYWQETENTAVQVSGKEEGPGGQYRRGALPELVTVEAVIYREIVDTIESLGTTYANESVSIISKVTDTVSRVHFEDGDHVDAGYILIEMTNSEESALLAESRANMDEFNRQLARMQELGAKGLVATSIIDEARSKADAAVARYNAITARMNDRLIRAPFSGKLGFREISPGSLLTPNTVITTLDDLSVIKLDFTVPEIYLGTINTGDRVLALSDAWEEREFEGVINSIGTRIDPVTRAVTVRALIKNPEEELRPGMLLTVNIITDVREALVIPESAFIQVANESFVYIAGADGLAHRQVIEIGARKFGYVEVINGLKAGDYVITEGGFKLQDKAPYKPDNKSQINLKLSRHAQPSWPS